MKSLLTRDLFKNIIDNVIARDNALLRHVNTFIILLIPIIHMKLKLDTLLELSM